MITSAELFQQASADYLCDAVPDNWDGMNDEEQSMFLASNVWEPLSNLSEAELFNMIFYSALNYAIFLREHGVDVQ